MVAAATVTASEAASVTISLAVSAPSAARFLQHVVLLLHAIFLRNDVRNLVKPFGFAGLVSDGGSFSVGGDDGGKLEHFKLISLN